MISYFLFLPHLYLYRFAIKHDSYYTLLFNSVFLILVTGQAIFIEYLFKTSNRVHILHEYPISTYGFYVSLLLYGSVLCIICIMLFFVFYNKKTLVIQFDIKRYYVVNINYSVLILLLVMITVYYFYIIGGLSIMLHSTRPSMVSGATLPLSMLLSISVVFSYKIYYKNKLLVIDYLIIIYILLLMFLSGSRVLIVYFTLMILFSINISYKIKLNIKIISLFFIAVFIVLIIGQAVKQIQGGESTGDILKVSLLVINLFYLVNTEAFAGFAGYITFGLEHYFSSDFGLGLLSGFLQFIPGQIRGYVFGDLGQFISSFYPYKYSIVPPGLQNFAIHFSLLSIIIYPLIFMYFTVNEYNEKMKKPHFIHFYVTVVFLTQTMTLIRGSTMFFVYYTGVHLVLGGIMYLFIIKKYSCKKNDLKEKSV